MDVKHVFIIGSNGIPAKYGGFETFVENLTFHKKSKRIKYHVACIGKDNSEFEYNNARCFNVKVPNIGAAKAEYYDLVALNRTIKYIKKNKIENATVYVLGVGIGLFTKHYRRKLHKIGAKLYMNPDGCEWKREKWNAILKKFFKVCEKKVAINSDLVICDSMNMEKYIKEEYSKYNPNTTFIAYGSNLEDIPEENKIKEQEKYEKWIKDKEVETNNYYLIVGRFVPENNYETMIKEFMKSKTNKDLVIVTNVEKNKFYDKLLQETKFQEDKRIKFVGTVYNKELLKKIRENAYAYMHGHEVGGTNPSLLEALATTKLNLLLDVGFNKEVAEESAFYWNKKEGNLSKLINKTEKIDEKEIEKYSKLAKQRIKDEYNWDKVVSEYEKIF